MHGFLWYYRNVESKPGRFPSIVFIYGLHGTFFYILLSTLWAFFKQVRKILFSTIQALYNAKKRKKKKKYKTSLREQKTKPPPTCMMPVSFWNICHASLSNTSVHLERNTKFLTLPYKHAHTNWLVGHTVRERGTPCCLSLCDSQRKLMAQLGHEPESQL